MGDVRWWVRAGGAAPADLAWNIVVFGVAESAWLEVLGVKTKGFDMSKLLHLEASPRKERSASIFVARAFIESYRAAHPADEVETWDLWAESLPEFDGETVNAKYQILHGLEHSSQQASAWQAVTDVFKRFNSADKYLLSVPMWNFGIPYKLKHFIDVITQPGLAFSFSPDTGYTGLVTGKPAAVIYTRGGEYSTNEQVRGLDFQKPYLETLLGFVGFLDIRSVVVEPTLGGPGDVDRVRSVAAEEAKRLAEWF